MRWILVAALLAVATPAAAQQSCRPGYSWSRRVVACVQTNCGDVQHAHYSYGGGCICGSAGSIAERPTDPNQACRLPSNHAGCPNCIYACVRPGRACPAAPGAPPRECNLDQAFLDLERDANALHRQGESLRRLIQTELPTFPALNYCVESSGSRISVRINGGEGAAHQLLSMVNAAESATDILGAFSDGDAATARGSFRNLSVGILRSLRQQVIEARTTSRRNNDALSFMRDTQQMAQNVERVRERMVCAVQRGLPEFYRRAQALEQEAEALEQEITSNPACASGLRRLIAVKLRELRRIYRWHAEGVVAPPGTSQRGAFVTRRTWLDSQVDAGRRPRIFSEYRCR